MIIRVVRIKLTWQRKIPNFESISNLEPRMEGLAPFQQGFKFAKAQASNNLVLNEDKLSKDTSNSMKILS